MDKQLTIVLPCYNEAGNIPQFFPELLAFAEKHNFKVIAVNDGSKDETLKLLQQFAEKYSSLKVLSHKINRGYGGAIKTGLFAVDTTYAITIDADGQHRLQDVLSCFQCIKDNNADLVVGARQNNQSGMYRTLGKRVIRAFAASLLKLPVQDLNSGMKCYRMSETVEYLELCPDTMAFSDVILLLMVNDRRLVIETPIQVEARTAGASTIGTSTALVTIAEILNLAVLLRPMTTFFRLSGFFLFAGIGWSTFTYCKSGILSSAAVMLMIFGFFCFALGLLAEQLCQIRKRLARSRFSSIPCPPKEKNE